MVLSHGMKISDAIALGRALRRAHIVDALDAESPLVVGLSPPSTAILILALELGEDGREDDMAVAELVSASDGNGQTLRRAALAARQENEHAELPAANLAHRLLQAAIRGEKVEPLEADERERLFEIDRFSSLSILEQWQTLVARDARLDDLLLVAESKDRETRPSTGRSTPDSRRHMISDLQRLAGPECDSSDVLLSSNIAFSVCRYCITSACNGSFAQSVCDQGPDLS